MPELQKGTSPARSRVYFPGMNTLRFFAASAVVLYHAELLKGSYGYSNYIFRYPAIANCGQMAVNFFFVLSGFLITYLLLEEKVLFGKIHIGSFYLRRILRIWPLYYIIALSGLYLFPHIPGLDRAASQHASSDLLLQLKYLLILPNIPLGGHGGIHCLNHLWSIGVEEQFYLIWPLLVHFSRSTVRVCLIIIGAFILYNLATRLNFHFQIISMSREGLLFFYHLSSALRMQCMAIGGVAAYLCFTKHPLLQFTYSPFTQAFTYLTAFGILLSNTHISVIDHEVYCTLFAIIIINVATNPRSFFTFEFKRSPFFGNISYGIYMYHMFALLITLSLFERIGITDFHKPFINLCFHGTCLGGTILIAGLSYYHLEKRILSLKKFFTFVKSGS